MTRAKDQRDRVAKGTPSTPRQLPGDEPAPGTAVGTLAGRVVAEGELVEPTGDRWDAES